MDLQVSVSLTNLQRLLRHAEHAKNAYVPHGTVTRNQLSTSIQDIRDQLERKPVFVDVIDWKACFEDVNNSGGDKPGFDVVDAANAE